jgi:NADPH:quinone reductase-like Zn-dependent oxidoreductase
VQLAALAGTRVFATEAAHNAEHVEALGAEAVIDFRTEDISTRVRELTDDRGLDAVVDTIGTDSATANLQLLVHGGGLAAIAGRPDLSAVPPFGMAPSVHEIAFGASYTVGDERARARLAGRRADLLALTAEDRLDPMPARGIALEDVPAALVELSGRGVRGKLVYVRD